MRSAGLQALKGLNISLFIIFSSFRLRLAPGPRKREPAP